MVCCICGRHLDLWLYSKMYPAYSTFLGFPQLWIDVSDQALAAQPQLLQLNYGALAVVNVGGFRRGSTHRFVCRSSEHVYCRFWLDRSL